MRGSSFNFSYWLWCSSTQRLHKLEVSITQYDIVLNLETLLFTLRTQTMHCLLGLIFSEITHPRFSKNSLQLINTQIKAVRHLVLLYGSPQALKFSALTVRLH